MVTLNRAVALLETVAADPRLTGHHRIHAVRHHLLRATGRLDAAADEYRTAAQRTLSTPARQYLLRRAAHPAPARVSRATAPSAVGSARTFSRWVLPTSSSRAQSATRRRCCRRSARSAFRPRGPTSYDRPTGQLHRTVDAAAARHLAAARDRDLADLGIKVDANRAEINALGLSVIRGVTAEHRLFATSAWPVGLQRGESVRAHRPGTHR